MITRHYFGVIKPSILLPLLSSLIVAFGSDTLNAVHASSSAPFLYYYSDFVHGVVIERADGTDSRVIGANAMNQNLFVAELTWSASNTWLAWRGEFGMNAPSIDGRQSEQLVISSRNGAKIIDSDRFLPPLTPDEAATIRFQWMPSHDGMLVERLVDPQKGNGSRFQLYVIDLTKHRIATTYETTLALDENPASMVWSPDEKYVVVTSPTEMFTLWMDGHLTRTSVDSTVSCNPSNLWPSSRSSEPFTTQRGNQLIITNKASGQSVIVKAPTEPIRSIDWSPNAQWALLNPCPGAGTMQLLSMRERTITSLPAQFESSGSPYDVQIWSPDSTRAVFVNGSGQIQILDIPSVKVISDKRAQVIFEKNSIADIALIRWAGSDQVYWSTTSGKIFRYDLVSRIVSGVNDYQGLFSLSPDSRYLATDCTHKEARGIYRSIRTCVTDISIGQTNLIMPNNTAGSPSYSDPFRWHSSGSWLITTLGGQTEPIYAISVGNVDGTVQRQITECVLMLCADWLPEPSAEMLLTHQSGSVLGQPDQTFFGHVDNVNSVAWSPDGSQIASGSTDGTVRLWDAKTGKTVRVFGKVGHSSVDRVSWSADGTYIYTWPDDNWSMVEVWNVFSGEPTAAANSGLDRLSVSPDKKVSLVINKDGTISLFDAIKGKPQGIIQADGILAWSHDSQLLFTWRTTYKDFPDHSNVFIMKNIQVWATRNGELLRELIQPSYTSIDLGSASVSPNSQLLAVTTFEDTTVWNVITGQVVLHVYQGGIISPVLGNTQVDWSPNSKKLALAASYSVQIWNISIPSNYF